MNTKEPTDQERMRSVIIVIRSLFAMQGLLACPAIQGSPSTIASLARQNGVALAKELEIHIKTLTGLV